MGKKPKAAGKLGKSAKPGKKRGRPPKVAAEAAPARVAAPKVKHELETISPAKLKSLMIELTEMAARKDRVVGAIRERIGDAVENDHLNKEVFALLRKLDKKEPEELAVFLDTLEAYLDASGLMDRAESVMELPLEAEKPAKAAKAHAKAKNKASGSPRANGNGSEAEASEEPAGSGYEAEPEDTAGKAPGGEMTLLPDSGNRMPNAPKPH